MNLTQESGLRPASVISQSYALELHSHQSLSYNSLKQQERQVACRTIFFDIVYLVKTTNIASTALSTNYLQEKPLQNRKVHSGRTSRITISILCKC